MDVTHFLVCGDMKGESEKKTLFSSSVIIHVLEKTGQEIFPNRKVKSLKKVLSFYYDFIVEFKKISLCK